MWSDESAIITSVDIARLRELASLTDGVEVRFKPTLKPYQQALLGTLGVRIVFDPNGSDPKKLRLPEPPARVPASAQPKLRLTGTAASTILRALADGQKRTGEIADIVGGDRSNTSHAIRRLLDAGRIVKVATGVYRLP